MDPLLPSIVGVTLVVIVLGVGARLLRQPYLLAYLLAGVLLGPHLLGWLDDAGRVGRLGAIGVVLLLFFVGLEVSLPALVRGWRVVVLGTLLQIGVSVGLVLTLGWALEWPLARSVLLGFVISLSSTAVVVRLLQDRGELSSPVGQNVLGVLLAQDLALVPMLIALQLLAEGTASPRELAAQGVGGAVFVGALVAITRRGELHLPLSRWLADDRELQVLTALGICLGLSLLSGLAGLSTALGAFLGGVVLAAARETHWIQEALEPFRVVFIALFFVSVGLLIDLRFLQENALLVAALVGGVLATNTFLNAAILKGLGEPWGRSLYAGALLAQIGEFSFVLAAVGYKAGLIGAFGYQTALATIALSLLVSPAWVAAFRRLTEAPEATGGRGRPGTGPGPASGSPLT